MRELIYLIGETGAARTSDPAMADALIAIGGYRRCTEEQYWQRMREIEAVDAAVAEREASDG